MNKMTDIDKLRESEQRYRLLFENMLNGFAYCKMLFDAKNNPVDFTYIEVNRKFEELTGLKDVIGKSVTKVIPGIKESNPEVFKVYGRVAMGGKPEKFELNLKPLAKLLSVSVYSSEKGYFTAVFENITERKLAEEKLRQSEEWFRIMVENSNEGIFRLSENGKIVSVNSCFAKMHGYKVSEIMKMNVANLDVGESAKLVPERMKRVLTGESMVFNVEHKCKDGKIIPLEVSASLAIVDGKKYILAFHRDITDRKEIERKLVEREQLLSEAQTVAGLGIYKMDFTKNRWESSEVLDEILGIDKNFVRSIEGWALLIHPDDRKMMTDYLQNEVIGKRVNFDKEYRIFQKNSGRMMWVHGFGKMTFDKENHPLILVGTIQNITERKEIEEGLSLQATALQASADAIVLTDTKGIIQWINNAFTRLSGYTAKDALGHNMNIVKSGEYDDAYYKKFWQNILAGKIIRKEIVNRRKDGSLYFEEETVTPVKDNNGKITHFISIKRDITGRKKSEDELKESEHRLNLNIQNMPVGMIEWDHDFQVVRWNPAAEKIFGYTEEEAMGKHARFIITEAAKPHVDEIWQQLISGRGNESTNENVTKDGRTIVCEWHNAPLTTTDGKVFGVVSMMLDVTEQKKRDEELSRIFNLSTDFICIAKPDGYFTKINPAWENILGFSTEEIMEMGYAKLIHPDDIKSTQDEVKKQIKGEATINFTNRYRRKDGAYRTIEWQATPAVNGDLYATGRDITERKEAEDALRKNEERFRSLIDAAPLCIKWFDAAGNLVSVNRHGKEEHFLVGKSDEEIKNWKYIECIDEKYRDLVIESMNKALRGKSSEFDMEHVPGTSTGHWCHSNLVPTMDDAGTVKYVLFISRDFTAEKIAQEEKNKNLEMLEKFKNLTVGRELKMIELKKKIGELTGKKEDMEE